MILTDDGRCSNPKSLKKNDYLRLEILRKTLKIEPGSSPSNFGLFPADLGFQNLRPPTDRGMQKTKIPYLKIFNI
jgi:hypothetical protein